MILADSSLCHLPLNMVRQHSVPGPFFTLSPSLSSPVQFHVCNAIYILVILIFRFPGSAFSLDSSIYNHLLISACISNRISKCHVFKTNQCLDVQWSHPKLAPLKSMCTSGNDNCILQLLRPQTCKILSKYIQNPPTSYCLPLLLPPCPSHYQLTPKLL